MSYCKESKTLAQTKLAELAYKEMLHIKYRLKSSLYKDARIYMYLQDTENCLDCETYNNLKIKLK